ncbi:hypothetical protein MC378_02835 [Polaribacter sp. MSW13]|uniref:Uncharacterized protein n=1 Tax=Polaribacter marinus TaxID=2916838 RepID=A0A9X2AJ68_9FLAO|nr:hypothetical protein [Polaribacter marinus]MCI2228088.1 hypothetical protein [Polaribacter marinus]
MKSLKTFIAVIAISLSTVFSTSATEKNPSEITKELRIEIVSILGDKIPVTFNKPTTVEVSFMINNRNEIVIISVDSDISEFSSFIKKKLNYKKLDIKSVKKGEIYKMPIKIKSNK